MLSILPIPLEKAEVLRRKYVNENNVVEVFITRSLLNILISKLKRGITCCITLSLKVHCAHMLRNNILFNRSKCKSRRTNMAFSLK